MKKLTFLIVLLVSAMTLSATIPKSVASDIKKTALKKWGTDFSMVKYAIKKQTAAYEKLTSYRWNSKVPVKIRKAILADARKAWGTDYHMVLYIVNKQQDAYISIN